MKNIFNRGEYFFVSGIIVLCFIFVAQVSLADVPSPDASGRVVNYKNFTYDLGVRDIRNYDLDPDADPDEFSVKASVHYPAYLNEAGDVTGVPPGPFPLIIFVHGDHGTGVPSETGYDYIAQSLATHGYIVVSIWRGYGWAGERNSNPDLVNYHIVDVWKRVNLGDSLGLDSDEFDDHVSGLMGKVDLSSVGTMGHSHGGKIVAKHFENYSGNSNYTIRAVMMIAPGPGGRAPTDIPIAVVLSYCDGPNVIDYAVPDLDGALIFDESRYLDSEDPDNAARHMVIIMGANHSFYNTIWSDSRLGGYVDDANGHINEPFCEAGSSRRLSSENQQKSLRVFTAAFFRTYLGGKSEFLPILTGDESPLPDNIANRIFVTYHAPSNHRLVVNKQEETEIHTGINTLGGDTSRSGSISTYNSCIYTSCIGIEDVDIPSDKQPHRELNLLKIGWSSVNARYQNDIPPVYGDVSMFDSLQFRAAVNFGDERNPSILFPNVAQDFHVVVTDGSGNNGRVRVSDISRTLFYAPGNFAIPPAREESSQYLPRLLLNGVRIPLAAFMADDPMLDLTDVASVRFDFDLPEYDQGSLFISDLAFTNSPEVGPVVEQVFHDRFERNDDFGESVNIGALPLVNGLDGDPGSTILDHYSRIADDRIIWRKGITGLTLHDEEDIDFFRFVLPDPSNVNRLIREETRFRRKSAYSPFTYGAYGRVPYDTILIDKSWMAIRRELISGGENERIALYHKPPGEPRDTISETIGTALSYDNPRHSGLTSRLDVSIGERRDTPRTQFGEYDLDLTYQIHIQRIPPVASGWLRDVIDINAVRALPCPGGFFPKCEDLTLIESFETNHPLGPQRPCLNDGCPDYLTFWWEGTAAFDLRFFSNPGMSFELFNEDQQMIARAIPPLNDPFFSATANSIGLQTLQSESSDVFVQKQLYVSDLPAGFYVLVVIGPESVYSVRFVTPPPAPDSDNDGLVDPFDPCPDDPEDVDGFRDGDGCPDPTVSIDIKPGSDTNSINLMRKGDVPVAILSTGEFDATSVNHLRVEFGPHKAEEAHGKGHTEDVDDDGDLDLVLHFRTQETGISCGDTESRLTGETFDGMAIEGFNSIKTVGCKQNM